MKIKKISLYFILIVALALIAGTIVEPKYFNQALDLTNSKLGTHFSHYNAPAFRLGLDLKGGVHLVYEADLSTIDAKDRSTSMQGLRDIIERRVNMFGISEPSIETQETGGKYRLVVELAGVKDPAEAIKMIGQTPFLDFREQKPEEETKKIVDKQNELKGKTQEEILKIADYQIAFDDPYFKSTNLTGKYLKSAQLAFDPNTNDPIILLQFNDEGAKIFEDLTAKNIGKALAIYIDNARLSAPVVQNKISGGNAQVTGKFTIQEAKELVRNLNAGALPVPIQMISQQIVGPTLGYVSLRMSLIAGIIGLLGVIVFMVMFYRLPGLFSVLALCVYILITLALFKLIPVTLTLAGIGGFILSIGMAVDANVLIFARTREELEEGKGVTAAIEEGSRRAWPSIRDSNFNSLIVCAVLFTFSTSFVKGFALTLALGIIVSMFSAIFITRILLLIFIRPALQKHKWLL